MVTEEAEEESVVNDIDFTPRWYRARLESATNRKRRLGFVGLLGLVMVCWFLMNEGRIRHARAALQMTRQSQEQSYMLRERLGKLRTQKDHLLQLSERYEALAQSLPPSIIFAEISHSIPPGASLGAFRLLPVDESAGQPSRRAAQASSRSGAESACEYCSFVVTMKARSMDREDLVVFIDNLRASPLFRTVHASATVMRDIGGVVVRENEIELGVLSAEYIGP